MTGYLVLPITRSRAFTTVRSDFNSKEARLYGTTSRTFSTAGLDSSTLRARLLFERSEDRALVALMPVEAVLRAVHLPRGQPVVRGLTCSAVASDFMTTITEIRPHKKEREKS